MSDTVRYVAQAIFGHMTILYQIVSGYDQGDDHQGEHDSGILFSSI